ncbi:putative 1,2-phenylacetyl-CoA epoxidase, subunit D [compost metagenome]
MLSVVDLGVVRDVSWEDGACVVVITPTYSGCPAMREITQDIQQTLARHGVADVRVQTRLAPAWTTDWMSEVAREKLRAYGIAPPQCGSSTNVLKFSRQALQRVDVPCPQCGSTHTTETSPFGSTACKSMYRCLDCLEPFDYFKPY